MQSPNAENSWTFINLAQKVLNCLEMDVRHSIWPIQRQKLKPDGFCELLMNVDILIFIYKYLKDFTKRLTYRDIFDNCKW